jgi:hypothetical protein
MTTNIILIYLATGLILLIFYYLNNQNNLTLNVKNAPSNNKLYTITQLNWKVKGLLWLSFVLIIISFAMPFILTRASIHSNLNFSHTGEIGDTIGGLMSPFIAMSGVAVTGLAFYIQYKANLLQRELFLQEQEVNAKQFQLQIDTQNRQLRIQQFESQFYEMLRLHRENVTEMKITGYDFEERKGSDLYRFEKITEGRKVFVTMTIELECILSMFAEQNSLNSVSFQKCYKIFFSGLDQFKKDSLEESTFIGELYRARNQHQHPNTGIKTNKLRKEFSTGVNLKFNYKPFSGHSSRLGHYFRHLYLTVKSVANSEVITDYNERMKYLRILRAQLSNHEQILLFYNWLGEFGSDWENDKNSFFAEYCMIHNLWYGSLPQYPFLLATIEKLKNKPVKFRKGCLFEVDE